MPEDQSPKVNVAAPAPAGPTKLDIFERIAKIVSLAAIPIVIPIALAIYGGSVQQTAQRESINRDYVQLSVSILKEKKDPSNEGLRDWAADLLAAHSPTRMPPYVVEALKSGQGLFAPPGPDVLAVSGDGKYLASSDGMGVAIWDIQHWRKLSISDTIQPITAMDFSPDGSALLTGFFDGTVHIGPVEQPTSNSRIPSRTLTTTGPVSAIKATLDGRIFVYSGRAGLSVWDASGRRISQGPMGTTADRNEQPDKR